MNEWIFEVDRTYTEQVAVFAVNKELDYNSRSQLPSERVN